MNEDHEWLSGRSQSFSDYSSIGREPNQHFEKLKISKSGAECRFINPAIHSEFLKTSGDAVPSTYSVKDRPRIEARCGDSADLPVRISKLQLDDNENVVGIEPGETYRCQSMDFTSSLMSSSIDTSAEQSGSSTRVERRCKILDISDQPRSDETLNITSSRRVVCSLPTSMSCSNIPDKRQNVHEEWLRKKQRALMMKTEKERLAEQNKREEEERAAKEKEEKEKKDRELFLAWSERKKKEEADKKKALEKVLELQQRLKDVEEKAAPGKMICMREWVRRKGEEQKAREKRKKELEKRAEEKKQHRLQESVKAYDSWKEKSKNAPRPSTQGLLPHQRAKPAYVNPNTWKSIIDDDEE